MKAARRYVLGVVGALVGIWAVATLGCANEQQQKGHELYGHYCSHCHGESGRQNEGFNWSSMPDPKPKDLTNKSEMATLKDNDIFNTISRDMKDTSEGGDVIGDDDFAVPMGISSTINNFGSSETVIKELNSLKGSGNLLNINSPAPDFVGITNWLNLPVGRQVLSMQDLRGKIVLVDFWTYTCINCIRTLPHVTGLYEKYKDQGFVVIGIHTPEFEFEKDTNNVEKAIKTYSITYPVAQDNNYATWNKYNNLYWPAEYLIDANGVIRRTHFGEGDYLETEMAIKALLIEAGKKVESSILNISDQTPKIRLSQETYLGSKRSEFYYPDGKLENISKVFSLTAKLNNNSYSLGGQWTITNENAISGKNSVLNYKFYANKVYLVLKPGPSNPTAKIKVFLDGNLLDQNISGQDVKDGEVNITSDRLYNLIDLRGKVGDHILRLEFQNSGIEVFAFTFG